MKVWKVFHVNESGELCPATHTGQAAWEVATGMHRYDVGVQYVSEFPFFVFRLKKDATYWAERFNFVHHPYVVKKVKIGGEFYLPHGLAYDEYEAEYIRHHGKSCLFHRLWATLNHKVAHPKTETRLLKIAATEMTIL